MGYTTLLQRDVDTWNRVVDKIRAHWEELSVTEQDSFNMLEHYWGKKTFDPGTCQKEIQILRSEAELHENVDLQAYMRVFCELCVKIYTRNEDILTEFAEIQITSSQQVVDKLGPQRLNTGEEDPEVKDEEETPTKESDDENEDLNDESMLKKYTREALEGDTGSQYELGEIYSARSDWEKAVYWYKRAAEGSSYQAQLKISECYEWGNGVPQNDKEAFRWLLEAACNKYTSSAKTFYRTSLWFKEGKGTEKNFKEAKRWYDKASEKDKNTYPPRFINSETGAFLIVAVPIILIVSVLISIFSWGFEGTVMRCKAILGNKEATYEMAGINPLSKEQWLEKAATLGHSQAAFELADYYRNRSEGKKAERWFLKTVELGGDEANEAGYRLAELYASNREVLDLAKAFKWYCDKQDDYPEAKYAVGKCYENGEGVSKNDEQAWFSYNRAEKSGGEIGKKAKEAADSLLNRKIYDEDLGDEENAKWYQRGADQGIAYAQNMLGVYYASGKGVTKDPKKAVYWYRMAANQGHAWGQLNLGREYYIGSYEKDDELGIEAYDNGLKKNYELAANLIEKSANQGIANAQNYMGVLYATGRGREKSKAKALEMFRKALKQGYKNAQENIDNFEYYDRKYGWTYGWTYGWKY